MGKRRLPQICVVGVEHGGRYTVTFREGLPAKDGQELADIGLTMYVRDHNPGVSFGPRLCPAEDGDAALPVQTVNTEKLTTLFRVTDRPAAGDPEQLFRLADAGIAILTADEVGEEIWSAPPPWGGGRRMSPPLAAGRSAEGPPRRIYALKAAVPG